MTITTVLHSRAAPSLKYLPGLVGEYAGLVGEYAGDVGL